MELSNSQYEAMTSVAKASLHLLRHLLTVNELLNRRRFQVLSGIFKLLDQSLFLVKNSLSTKEISNKVKASKEIFQEALQFLHDVLEKHFRWNLFHASENGRDEELQVTICFYCHFWLTVWLTDVRTDGRTDEQMDWLTDYMYQTDWKVYRQTDGPNMDGEMTDRSTDGPTNGRTDGRMDER